VRAKAVHRVCSRSLRRRHGPGVFSRKFHREGGEHRGVSLHICAGVDIVMYVPRLLALCICAPLMPCAPDMVPYIILFQHGLLL
jgi:hypothetical protein